VSRGSIVGYVGIAALDWYVIRRWKGHLLRDALRHGQHVGLEVLGRRHRALIVLCGEMAVALLFRDVLWAI
jgi:hypothetical protein